MKNFIMLGLIFGMLVLPIVSADILLPGYHGVGINNYITNINDFPDYVFVSYGQINPDMCPVEIIQTDGIIRNYYKNCNPSIYAIPKEKFPGIEIITNRINNARNESLRPDPNVGGNTFDNELYLQKVEEIFNSIGAKEVIKNVNTYTEVLISSPTKEINNFYTIDLSKVLIEPTEINKKRNNLIYVYIIIPIMILIIFIWLILRRRK